MIDTNSLLLELFLFLNFLLAIFNIMALCVLLKWLKKRIKEVKR